MASEENPAESQQCESLPESNLAPAEERGQQPVPEMHDQFAANPDEKRDRKGGQNSNPNPFLNLIHVVLLICSYHFFVSFLHKLIVNFLQAFAQMKHGVALAREQSVDADAAFRPQLFEAAPLEFVSDEYFSLLAGQFVER